MGAALDMQSNEKPWEKSKSSVWSTRINNRGVGFNSLLVRYAIVGRIGFRE